MEEVEETPKITEPQKSKEQLQNPTKKGKAKVVYPENPKKKINLPQIDEYLGEKGSSLMSPLWLP